MASASAKKWWKNAIVYQIYPRSFCDSNGDGIGDIPGITSKLNYLKELGVDVIWLSPVYPSPGYDNGYDISDYKGINPEIGTMEDMERLISRAKRIGIKIIMDIVINHTSSEHEWFKRALEGAPDYRDYYYFKEGHGGKKPNNWQSFLGGHAWTKTDQGDYYLHLFSDKQPDLNWHNPKVYEEIADVMRFWLDKGIAGFRCDLINIIYKNSLENGKKRLILTGREHYLNTEGCHELLKRFNAEVWSKYKSFIVGDTVFVTPDDAKLLSDEARAELDTVFCIEHMDVDSRKVKWFKKKFKPHKFIGTLDKCQDALEFPANSLEKQNQIRAFNHFGNNKEFWEKSAKLLCGLNLSLKGIPFIYEGEEIGMIKDAESYSANANKAFINVEAENADEESILSFYKSMIKFRKNSTALSEGTYRKVASPNDVYIFTRESKEERLYIYCNLTSTVKPVEFYGDRIIFCNYDDESEDNALRPYEYRIIASNI